MMNDYSRMKAVVQSTDPTVDQIQRRGRPLAIQVQELTDLLTARNEEEIQE